MIVAATSWPDAAIWIAAIIGVTLYGIFGKKDIL